MLKKILIASIIFFVLAVGITGYVVFIKKSPSETTDPIPNEPFGGLSGDSDFTSTPAQGLAQDENGNFIVPVSNLMNISSQPVAGAQTFSIGTSTIVRFNLRSSGHVYDVNLSTGTSSKITNTTIPKIYESVWFNNGLRTLVRYVNESGEAITTYNAEVKISTSTSSEIGTLSGTFLPSNISSVSIAPTTKDVFYFTEDTSGGRGYTTNSAGSNSTLLFTSPLSEWNTQWPTATTIALTTKPSQRVDGYLYFLNPKTKALRKVMGEVPGLTTLVNPSGELVAYANNLLNLSIYTIKTGAAVTTNLTTLPEKCVWAQNSTILYCAVPIETPLGTLPDDWYQGKVSFADEIYRIDTKNKNYAQVSTLQESYTNPIDAINLTLSKNEGYLVFTNKIDGSLWSLNLAQ